MQCFSTPSVILPCFSSALSHVLCWHACVVLQPRRARAGLAQSLKESSSEDDEAQSVESEASAGMEDDNDKDYE